MPSAAAADRITGRLSLAGWLIPHVHALLLKHYCGHAPFAEVCLTLREAFGPWPGPAADASLQDAQRRHPTEWSRRTELVLPDHDQAKEADPLVGVHDELRLARLSRQKRLEQGKKTVIGTPT